MSDNCIQCGEPIDLALGCCQNCGFQPVENSDESTIITFRDHQAQSLISQAKEAQRKGDTSLALHLAQKALALRPDCSTVHAMLGYLHEQASNCPAAQKHFDDALKLEPGNMAVDTLSPGVIPPRNASRASVNNWLTFILIGCVICSGLAFLFTVLPDQRRVLPASVVILNRPQLPGKVGWKWTEPSGSKPKVAPAVPTESSGSKVPAPLLPSPPPETGVKPATLKTPHDTIVPATTLSPTPAPVKANLPDNTSKDVIGPSVKSNINAGAVTPDITVADQAYINGNYEVAIAIYEEILKQEAQPNPRLYQDLANCYQLLGDSQQAKEHLTKAITQYKALLAAEPQNAAAQKGLQSCETALNTLITSKEHPAAP